MSSLGAEAISATDSKHILPPQEIEVRFWPPLYEQRRAWVLDILRREGISSVIDIGCGEGSLLQCLTNPASYITSSESPISPTSSQDALSYSNGAGILNSPELHVRHAVGLDIYDPDLDAAIKVTAPTSQDAAATPGASSSRYSAVQPRWESLDVEIWKGGLEVFNEAFVNAQCIVSMEVIEHLSPDTLPYFAPMLLGAYRPQFLLITTPSYTYNARMRPANVPESQATGFPDPTGRTNRVFRHADHKFEWTVDEFTEYCHGVAETWGYDVEIGGVGKTQNPDPWDRDAELGFASQVACFRRRAAEFDQNASIVSELQCSGGSKHELLVHHHHPAHPMAKSPRTTEEVQDSIIIALSYPPVAHLDWAIHDIWFHPGIAEQCGGYIDYLIDAIESCEELKLVKDTTKGFMSWIVALDFTLTNSQPTPHVSTGIPLEASGMHSSMDADERNLVAALDDVNIRDTEHLKDFLSRANIIPEEYEFDTWTVATRGSPSRHGGEDTGSVSASAERDSFRHDSVSWGEPSTGTNWGTSSILASDAGESIVGITESDVSRDEIEGGWTDASIIRWSEDGGRLGMGADSEDAKWGENIASAPLSVATSPLSATWSGRDIEEEDAVWQEAMSAGSTKDPTWQKSPLEADHTMMEAEDDIWDTKGRGSIVEDAEHMATDPAS